MTSPYVEGNYQSLFDHTTPTSPYVLGNYQTTFQHTPPPKSPKFSSPLQEHPIVPPKKLTLSVSIYDVYERANDIAKLLDSGVIALYLRHDNILPVFLEKHKLNVMRHRKTIDYYDSSSKSLEQMFDVVKKMNNFRPLKSYQEAKKSLLHYRECVWVMEVLNIRLMELMEKLSTTYIGFIGAVSRNPEPKITSIKRDLVKINHFIVYEKNVVDYLLRMAEFKMKIDLEPTLEETQSYLRRKDYKEIMGVRGGTRRATKRR